MYTDTTSNYSSPIRNIGARVDLYKESALAASFNKNGALKSFKVERVGEKKFFGFGICQKLNVHLIDKNRELSITTDNSFDVFLTASSTFGNSYFPRFYVTETHRDEKTNELSITAYDAIYRAAVHTVSELGLSSYTIAEFAQACAEKLSLRLVIDATATDSFAAIYQDGANYNGSETLREALNAVAEVTQTIYFANGQGELVFKRLAKDALPLFSIGKAEYFKLESGDNRRLATVAHTTELGDNVSASITTTGSVQYIRDNPFWNLREDVGELVSAALAVVGGLTINQFSCSWRGNPLLEIGDKISLVTKDNDTVISYLLDDVISFDGALEQKTQWEYEDNEAETADNPATLGDALKQTFAKVDKVNREIDLVANDTNANTELLAAIQINTSSITSSVEQIQTNMNSGFEAINEQLRTVTSRVETVITPEDMKILIDQELEDNTGKVVTSTGYTFDEKGLNISKTDSEMATIITDDGMVVYKNDETVLTANNNGVFAQNLHATTYLIIGENSRFEDYESDGEMRTGCFWIGG